MRFEDLPLNLRNFLIDLEGGEKEAYRLWERIRSSGLGVVETLVEGLGYREEKVIELLSKHYGNNYTNKAPSEVFFTNNGVAVDQNGYKYFYYPIEPDVILVPYSEYKRLRSSAKGQAVITAAEDPVAFFDNLVLECVLLNINDILINGQGAIYTIYVKQLGGGLVEKYALSKEDGEKLVRSIKARASKYSDVKVNVNDRSQSGKILLEDYAIELRVEFLPAVEGESVSIRVYNVRGYFNKTLEELNYRKDFIDVARRVAVRKNGLIIIGGATGQGKSTLIKSMVLEQNPFKKVVRMVEDPVEIRLKGATQMQTSEAFTFADAIRSFMRAVPDIIVIGETRDGETALSVIDAAMSGHLTYTTIHANDCVGNLERFILKLLETNRLSRDEALANISSALLLTANQVLIRTKEGKLLPIVEWIEPDETTRLLIAKGEFTELRKHIQNPIPHQISELYTQGLIDEETYAQFCS